MKYILFALSLSIVLISSCGSNELPEVMDFTESNENEIVDYLNANNLTAERSSSGLYYVVNEPGDGEQPVSTSNVTVAYKGYFTNGNVFDESDENGIAFNLNQVIPGWTEGIAKFKEGGSGILLIHSRLGYGNFGTRGIPGGAVLVFDVNLISINN